jgi:hypothetical protein
VEWVVDDDEEFLPEAVMVAEGVLDAVMVIVFVPVGVDADTNSDGVADTEDEEDLEDGKGESCSRMWVSISVGKESKEEMVLTS